ncbi:MAG: MerR family DNA-binding transcriptional regulator [PVC group bacterium]|nr:MerR family DNA-binding transcriptional regulator [PVC group bacterium]
MADKIFSISEAAQYLGVFPLTLRNWEKKGLLRSFRTPGGHRRFKKSELDRIIGVEKEEDKITEAIRKLQEIQLSNGRQETINIAIENLKKIAE